MLVLFETAAGHALFKVQDEAKLANADDVFKHFATPEKAAKVLKLKGFNAFKDTTEAVAAATDMVDGKMGKTLKKFLKKNVVDAGLKDKLAVSDKALGSLIKDKLSISCVNDSAVNEVMRGIRANMDTLITGLEDDDLKAMTLGLSHSLSRYKLKFSADKVDTMIVQAIGLLDELDKEINTYSMRVREWFGWHFPRWARSSRTTCSTPSACSRWACAPRSRASTSRTSCRRTWRPPCARCARCPWARTSRRRT